MTLQTPFVAFKIETRTELEPTKVVSISINTRLSLRIPIGDDDDNDKNTL